MTDEPSSHASDDSRNRGKEKHRESEQRQRIAAEAARLGVFEWHPDEDRPIWTNQRMWEIFGLPTEHPPLSMKELEASYLHADDRDKLEQALEKARTRGEMFHARVRIRRNSDGQWRWIEYYGQFVSGPPPPPALIGVLRDVTDEVQNREKLQEAHDALEERVRERTAELRETNQRLRHLASQLTSAENRERKRLAMLLHDDLQQLLVAAQLQIANLRNKVGDADVSALIERLADVIDQAQDSTHDLTRQLRPTALYEVGITPAVRWLVHEMKNLHGLEVEIDAEREAFDLKDDIKALLFEAVRELLFNVVKHSGVQQAKVVIRQTGEDLLLRVEDRGKGFDAARQEQETAGGGMGLFAIRERLAALGGHMKLESVPGDGSRSELTIPVDIAREEEE